MIKSLFINTMKSILYVFILILISKAYANTLQGQWVLSEELKPGMKILTADNQVLTVAQPWQLTSTQTTTYNIEVENNHTYYVSKAQLWNHNMTDCEKPGLWQRIKNRVWGKKPKPYEAYSDPVVRDAQNLVDKIFPKVHAFDANSPVVRYSYSNPKLNKGQISYDIHIDVLPKGTETHAFNQFMNELQGIANKHQGRAMYRVYTHEFNPANHQFYRTRTIITREVDGSGVGGIFR